MAAQVKIFTTAWCGYCRSALSLLRKKGIDFEQIDADDPKTRKWLREVTGRTTVPQIFIDGQSVGGYTDIRDLDERGELDRLLAGSGDAHHASG
ncbi:MAG TPA: glutaredoxin [Kofleriaceae bacterium]|nr:glutaredoxin [Kofleriaceae bacterium]